MTALFTDERAKVLRYPTDLLGKIYRREILYPRVNIGA
jgi:hypothetical protein